jgi:hypothetical protein
VKNQTRSPVPQFLQFLAGLRLAMGWKALAVQARYQRIMTI